MANKPINPKPDTKPTDTYHEPGVNDETLTHGRTVHIDPGDRLPPTQKPNRGWRK